MKTFTIRLTEKENAQLLKLINEHQKENERKLSKNKMIIKLIGDKYNEQEK